MMKRNGVFTLLFSLLIMLNMPIGSAYTLEKTLYEDSLHFSSFFDNSVSYAAIIDEPALLVEYGSFGMEGANETVWNNQIDLELGEDKLFYPNAYFFRTQTILMVNSVNPTGKEVTHLYVLESNQIQAHHQFDGDVNDTTRIIVNQGNIIFGYATDDSYLVAHYDIANDKVHQLFDLKSYLDVSGHTFMMDFVEGPDGFYLAAGFTSAGSPKYVIIELTITDILPQITPFTYSTVDGHVFSLMPTSTGVWAYWTDFKNGFMGHFQRDGFVGTYGLPNLGENTNSYPRQVAQLDTDEFIAYSENRLCRIEIIENSAYLGNCSSIENGRFSQLLTQEYQVAVATMSWDGQGSMYIFHADNPPEEFKASEITTTDWDSNEDTDDDTASLELGFSPFQILLGSLVLATYYRRE
ncbi:MAG: hypothetical protein ACXADH_07990 [Candidatus Kariarchaeaceae archaeon]|jgi:hypothetical protein